MILDEEEIQRTSAPAMQSMILKAWFFFKTVTLRACACVCVFGMVGRCVCVKSK